ncbi:hypothetical protein [Microcoleus sp.]|uniref:hypothetical protein n=1 Tax=Microcoleus sp. TaxID=44472 RepID=UPI0035933512
MRPNTVSQSVHLLILARDVLCGNRQISFLRDFDSLDRPLHSIPAQDRAVKENPRRMFLTIQIKIGRWGE